MNVDHRLHRAAHDLRELDIEIPPLPLESSASRAPRVRRLGVPAAVAALFALGAVAAGSELVPSSAAGGQVAATVVTDMVSSGDSADRDDRPLSPREEVAMIWSLQRAEADPTPIGAQIPPGVS